MADGATDKDIAATLHISLDGVDALLSRIAKQWELDPLKNRRAQITSHVVTKRTQSPAA